MTAVWQSGHTYVPGSLVKPLTTPAPGPVQIVNGDFETGSLSGWAQSLGAWSISTTSPYAGANCAITSTGGAGPGAAAATLDQAAVPCKPGQSITLGAYAEITNAGTDNGYAAVFLLWYNSSMGLISVSGGNQISGQGGAYHNTTVTGSAPAGCAFVVARLTATAPSGGTIRYDNVSWNYVSIAAPAGLIFKATQAAPGKSGSSEPAWPSTVGASVTDNQVTWEGVLATRLIWQASPLMTSGGTEPAWPTQNGGSVRDGTINWTAQSSAITDVNCPHSKIVMIAASKVYAADNDIIRYCATVNPLDWTTPNDAGYIAFGLQTYGSNPVAAMNLYRSNLVPFNAEGFQMWQVDPDPANIDLLDALPIASTFNRALSPVANDLLFLSSQGVRSVGIAASSTNLQAGDVGMPIDELVQAAMRVDNNPLSTYIPSAGQYWLAFSDPLPPALSISGNLPDGELGAAISYQYTIEGGVGPYVVTLLSGALPTTSSIDAAGLVTGTRTALGIYSWQLKCVDSLGQIALLNDTSNTYKTIIYVSDSNTNKVYGIDHSTGALIATIPVGTVANGLAISPDGTRVYCANFGASTVSVINTSTNLVIASIAVGTNPSGICVSKDGTRAYTANSPYAGAVSVIDLTTNHLITTNAFAQPCTVCSTNPVNGDIYVVSSDSNIYVLNQDGTTKTNVAFTNPSGVKATPDGKYFCVVGYLGIAIFNATSYAYVGGCAIRGGYGPQDVGFSLDGNTAYVIDLNYTDTKIIDMTNKAVPAVIGSIAGTSKCKSCVTDPYLPRVYATILGTGANVINTDTNTVDTVYAYGNFGIVINRVTS